VVTVRTVNEYEVYCERCGYSWRMFAETEPDYAECIGCCADAFRVTLIGVRFEP